MATTNNLAITKLEASQAQKDITVNEALITIDALLNTGVIDRDLTAPPGTPAEGDIYIVAAAASGDWLAKEHHIAHYDNGAWRFIAPNEGLTMWLKDENTLITYNGSTWGNAVLSLQNLPLLGVNAAADSTNRISATTPAVLLNAETDDIQLKLNKAAAGDTASVIFQTGFSGRAEFGLTGDDDFHMKVSPDGSTFYDAIIIDADTGFVNLPFTPSRRVLTADEDFYVNAATGSDSNDGLTSGAAFSTIQKAIDVAYGALDLSHFDVTIHVADGTYTELLQVSSPVVGSGSVEIIGNTATPENCIIDSPSDCLRAQNLGAVRIEGFKLLPSSSRHCLYALSSGIIYFDHIQFGAASRHIFAFGKASVFGQSGDYGIIDNAAYHIQAGRDGLVNIQNSNVTLTGTPHFSADFCRAYEGSMVLANGASFTGAATGSRYDVSELALIKTSGGGAGFFPGDVAGTDGTGGVYT